jgi:hypothetical protein
MRSNYFDNNFARSLQAALVPAQINNARIASLSANSGYGTSGFDRALNWMNAFAAPGTTPPTTSPTPVYTPQTGNEWGSLGANMFKGAFNIGNTVGWDKLFSKTPAAPMGPANGVP